MRTLPRSRAGRAGLGLVVAVALVAFTTLWAIPNVAGASFVEVRAVAIAHPSSSGAVTLIGGSPSVTADRIDVSVEVGNRYPLSVVVGASGRGGDFRAAVYRRDASGQLISIWHVSSSDPGIEEGSDSPMGGSSAAVIAPGTTRYVVADGATAFRLIGPSGPIGAGVYYLRVWAYGIAGSLVPISVDAG